MIEQKNIDKVYILMGDEGERDDYHSWIESTFRNKQDAEDKAEEYNKAYADFIEALKPYNKGYNELCKKHSEINNPIIKELSRLAEKLSRTTGKYIFWQQVAEHLSGQEQQRAKPLLEKYLQ